MPKKRDKAELLDHLSTRLDLSTEERVVLREAADLLRERAAAAAQRAARSKPAPPTPAPQPPGKRVASAPLEAILWTDGGSRGNPGPAGAGAILKDLEGATLGTCSEYLGHTTNNVAEYTAVVLGLQRALDLGLSRIELRADSQLLIRQLQGDYRVKSDKLKPLYARASRLLERFEYAKLTHVPREQNAEADQLANEGMDSA